MTTYFPSMCVPACARTPARLAYTSDGKRGHTGICVRLDDVWRKRYNDRKIEEEINKEKEERRREELYGRQPLLNLIISLFPWKRVQIFKWARIWY